jgi:hypothetical protein
MREVLPGLYHWTVVHPKIQVEVSSYWLDDAGVLVDPLVPPDVGIEWFAQRSPQPRAIVLSNRHHYRDSARFVEVFGCEVLCNRAGLHEFTHGEDVSGFDIGEPLPGDLLACEVDGICPDDTALYLGDSLALFFADGLVRSSCKEEPPGPLGFVPDLFMDDPERTKQRLLTAFASLLGELTFEHVLLAHGGPVIGDGCAQLQELLDSGGRTVS